MSESVAKQIKRSLLTIIEASIDGEWTLHQTREVILKLCSDIEEVYE